ncbi:hypothetical protein [Kosakonia phage Kc283]|uniref:Uncharacterized protein n=1 Tax=Kosakonia phage Kc283 TaxID=2863195 RepID=A0AAE7WFG8_9CAUD|nr:hypothetical protein PP755_gp83 [Kosakonia phage Kc283]QYN79890.1 hypothetical protein [Kosakonia phage Kc283]
MNNYKPEATMADTLLALISAVALLTAIYFIDNKYPRK